MHLAVQSPINSQMALNSKTGVSLTHDYCTRQNAPRGANYEVVRKVRKLSHAEKTKPQPI